jgi:hypothetical protein
VAESWQLGWKVPWRWWIASQDYDLRPPAKLEYVGQGRQFGCEGRCLLGWLEAAGGRSTLIKAHPIEDHDRWNAQP